MIFLETERLHLRNVIESDVNTMFDYRNNEICARYQRGQTKTLEGIKDLVQRRKDDTITTENPFMLAVALKDTNEMIGEIVVMPNENTFSLGYTFSYKYHRQGFAFEALSNLIAFLHDTYRDWEFISFTDPDNLASRGLLIKLGYKELGYIPSKESQVYGKWITKATEEEIAQVIRKRKRDMNNQKYELRDITENDYIFIYEVKKDAYKKYVEKYFGGWVEEQQKDYFKNFIETYRDGAMIICFDGKDIGFYNDCITDECLEIGNICIIPEYQNKGIGTNILKDILSKNNDKEIHIQYFKDNPVGNLYERLGFKLVGETTYHYQMVKDMIQSKY